MQTQHVTSENKFYKYQVFLLRIEEDLTSNKPKKKKYRYKLKNMHTLQSYKGER
jgi:hypothetical protein